jgi:DNA-directed RNA polymerase specialized sigma24 family protein
MKPTSILHQQFESLYATEQRFFKQIIARYFDGAQQQDVLQDFSLHLYGLLAKQQQVNHHYFDSRAWLRKVLVHFCISQLRKDQAQKNSVWQQTTVKHVLVAPELAPQREFALQALYLEALGCVDKKEALILKMKYEYKRSSKEIEQRLAIQHVDVLISRIRAKIKKKIGRIDLDWL